MAPVDEDNDSTTPKPDDVPGPSPRKRKRVTRSEFNNFQVQVSSVTAAINNFGDMLKSFIGDGKKPRFDDEVLAAQSASYPTQVATSAAHAATFLGDHTTFAAVNNFGDMLKSFIGDGKKPRFDDEVLAAQSASYPTQVATSAAHAATLLGDHTAFAPARSGSGPYNLVPSFALQSHPNEEAAHFTPVASPGCESLLSVEAMETGFNPVYPDPDFRW